jgi:hypothetical protein
MNSEHRMNRRTCLPIAIALLAIGAAPALAQSVVGGPTKPINHIGGAASHPNPVVPPAKGVAASATPSNPTSTKNLSNPTSTKTPPNPTSAKNLPNPTSLKKR